MRVKVRLGLMTAAAVAVVVVVSVTSYFSVANLLEDQKWLAHSRQVLDRFHNLLFRMAAATATERGYLLTGEQSHLDDYGAQVKLVQTNIEELKKMVSDNEKQVQLLASLSGVLEERFHSFDESISVFQTKGQAAAIERVKLGQSRQFTKKIELLEKAFEEEELLLLDRRNDEMVRSINATRGSILAGGLLSLTLVAVFNFFFGSHIVNSIRRLLNASENAEQGRFSFVELDSDDEFGELAEAFNHIGLTLEDMSRRNRAAEKEAVKLNEVHQMQQATIQQLNGLIDELAVEFQSYYAALDSTREELNDAVRLLESAVENNGELGKISTKIQEPLEFASHNSTVIVRTVNEVRRLLSTTEENLDSLKKSIEESSEQADKLAGLQSELDNISNALEVISMSVDMATPEGQPVLGAVMTRLHELSERCHQQRQIVGVSISRMQTLLSRGMLTTHAASGAESTGRQLLQDINESMEGLLQFIEQCHQLSDDLVKQVNSQGELLDQSRISLSDMSDNRRRQIEVIERLQQSVGQTADDYIRT